jgi:hypothetical protein
MKCNRVGKDLRQAFSIGNRVMVVDALTPSTYISGIISSQPKIATNSSNSDFLYEILVDFYDDILSTDNAYKRITVPSACLTLI